MASGVKQCKTFRHWKNSDSMDPSDTCQLYERDKVVPNSEKRWRISFTLCLLFICFVTLFLLGILVGFCVRESQKVTDTCASEKQRVDGLDNEKLQSVHQNIMYFLSSHSIKNYKRKLADLRKEASPNFLEESRSDDFVAKEFKKIGLDDVKIEEHSVVVTYPDPRNPSRLELVDFNSSVTEKIAAGDKNILKSRGDNSNRAGTRVLPFAAFTPSGVAEGRLVYAGHGEYLDYLQLRAINISVTGAIVLIRHGKSTDSRKVHLAEKYGASGVLLYCHSDDCVDGEAQFTSVADFSDGEPYYPNIPVQTVSQTVATRLLRNISTTSLPSAWLPSVRRLLRKEDEAQNSTLKRSDSGLQLRLTVNTVRSTVVVKNVIGTIHGGTESDRYVMLGAKRSPEPFNSTDSFTNTAVLLEIARSLAYIKNTEGWVPRRGIRICSWGGAALSNVGLVKHILNAREGIGQSMITSIDIDQHASENDMKIITSPGLANLVKNVVQMVPDPLNGENSIGDSWPALSVDELVKDNSSLVVYRDVSLDSFPFFAMLRVPSIKMKSVHTSEKNQKYLLSHARVISLQLSILADRPILPFSVKIYAEYTKRLIEQSANHLKQYLSKNHTDTLLKAATEVSRCSKQWGSGKQYHGTCQSELDKRKINNILQGLDGHLVKQLPNIRERYLLSPNRGSTYLEVTNSAIDNYKLTNDRERLDSVVTMFISSLQNLANSLCYLKQTI